MLPCRWRPCPLRPGNGQVCGTNSIWRGETNTSELSSDLSCLTEGTQDPFGIHLGCWLPQTLLFQSLVSRGSCDHLAFLVGDSVHLAVGLLCLLSSLLGSWGRDPETGGILLPLQHPALPPAIATEHLMSDRACSCCRLVKET